MQVCKVRSKRKGGEIKCVAPQWKRSSFYISRWMYKFPRKTEEFLEFGYNISTFVELEFETPSLTHSKAEKVKRRLSRNKDVVDIYTWIYGSITCVTNLFLFISILSSSFFRRNSFQVKERENERENCRQIYYCWSSCSLWRSVAVNWGC